MIAFWGGYIFIISAVLFAVTMYFAIKIEKYKKDHDIQTDKETVAFTEGKRLDKLEKTIDYKQRAGKLPGTADFPALCFWYPASFI